MKHTINSFLMIAIMSIAMFTACNKDEVSNPSADIIDHKEIDVPAVGGQTLISVNTDQTWNASADVDWVKVLPASGNGSEIVNVEIDKHLGARRTGKINFKVGSATATVNITQRGMDTATFMDEQVNRRVLQTEYNGTTATVIWDAPTPNCAISELEYETSAGWARIVVTNSETQIECPDPKADAPYRVRSGFIVPLMGDTLFKDWTVSQSTLVSSFPTGTLKVHPRSYSWNLSDGNLRAPVPVSEYATPRTVEIEAVADGVYKISDLFGGYYSVGRGYSDPVNNSFSPYGIFSVDGETYSLIEYGNDNWGSGFSKIEGYNNQSRGTLTLDAYWNNAGIVFHQILCTETSSLDNDGYVVVNGLPFKEQNKYELNAIRWTGTLGSYSAKFGALVYKVTVTNSGKMKIVDHASNKNMFFEVATSKSSADNGDSDIHATYDGVLEFDATPGTYYVFGILNAGWYPDVNALETIDYDIEITCE